MLALLRFICLGLVRVFYAHIRLQGRENVPAQGPIIIVANHLNGLIDPMVLRMAMGRPIGFLAKSTLFHGFIGRKAMEAFGAIPVYRPKEADASQNTKTFDMARQLMANKGWLALFPEGVSHSETVMQPLKTGAARIALSSGPEVRILPVGLSYNAKETFRSSASATVGLPFAFDRSLSPQDLTKLIGEKLAEVVLQHEDREFWQGFRFVARWIKGHEDEAFALQLAKAYRALDPALAEPLVEEARAFARLLEAAGVEDPRALTFRLSLGRVFLLMLGAPIALIGLVLAWIPYRITGPVARKLAGKEADLISTIKAIAGMVFIGTTYMLEALAVGFAWRWEAGVAFLPLAPVTGFVAMRYAELGHVTRRAMLSEIGKRRDAFIAHVSEALVKGAS